MACAHVFGIPVEGSSQEELLRVLASRKTDSQPYWIVTANPEILLRAREDSSYANAIKQADVRTVDGFGIWLVLRLKGIRTHRVTGIDFAETLVKMAEGKEWRVACVGGAPGVAEKACVALRERYPQLICHAEQGGNVAEDGTDDEAGEEARHRLTLFDPQIMLVAFGHPKQEQWILRNLNDFPYVRVVMGVGQTLDVWAGVVRRAPRVLQKLGFEWLWRLFCEPSRWKRIVWRAFILFPFRAWKDIH
ncbi:MAG: WecB/TagA/CpsF family glycosyltransferase [Patescibacteria group bacterium]